MGSGLYDLLGWGRIRPPYKVDEDNYMIDLDEMFDLLCDGLVRSSYETAPQCLVVPLAISEPWLQDYKKLPPMPLWVPRVAPRRARYVTAPAGFVVPEAAKDRWTQVQGIYQRAGMRLPKGRLVLLNDWD